MSNINLTSLPPLPPVGESGRHACNVISLYLAVWDDLTPEQQYRVAQHVRICVHCTAEQRLMQSVSRLAQRMEASSPSARVDQAVMAAISKHSKRANGNGVVSPLRPNAMHPLRRKGISLHAVGLVAVAAVMLLTVVATVRFARVPSSPQQAFLLPTTVTWAGFVLYHVETRLDKNGQHYQVNCYHDLRNNHVDVETVQIGMLDVVAVSDAHETLGLDMMHHVAQWGASDWMIDDSMFNLQTLQNDLSTQQDVYLGTDQFRGQEVYRIRVKNGLVMLLDMHYMPVNVLRGAVGPGTGEPVYDTFRLLQPAQVPNYMWNMSVPAGFKMGALPARP